ncbi:MAG: phytase [Bacteroidota bacterium]
MRLAIISLSSFVMWGLIACSNQAGKVDPVGFVIKARVETEAVKSAGDAADDPAVWINPVNRKRSLIFASDTKDGILAYDLKGKQKAYYPIGKVNNIDVVYGLKLDSTKSIDLLGCTKPGFNTLEIFKIQPNTGLLKSITSDALFSSVGEVYGMCMYKSAVSGKIYAFVGGRKGEVEQWELQVVGNELLSGEIVRKFSLPSKCEGMVADHELGYLYIAEENNAIWRIAAEPDQTDDRFLVTSLEGNKKLAADLEGLAIYPAANKDGFLIASSQGNSSYAIFKRTAPYPYLGSFHIGSGEEIDGTNQTDGIEVVNLPMGEDFPLGMFIAQDGSNLTPEGKRTNQNFKLVGWDQIMDSLGSHALIDTVYHPFLKPKLDQTVSVLP